MAVTLRELLRHHGSLLHGWIPTTVQVLAGIALVAAIYWGIRRWRYVWVPWAVLCGIALTAGAYWYVESEGLAGNPAPAVSAIPHSTAQGTQTYRQRRMPQ